MIQEPERAVASAHFRAQLVLILLVIIITLDCIGAVSTFAQLRLLQDIAAGVTPAPGIAESNDSRQSAITVLQLLFLVGTAVMFIMWMYSSHRILTLLGARSLAFTPGWTIAAFFIPIQCLWKPFKVMSEIWCASDPNAEGEQSWQWQNPPAILRWWWGFFLVTNLSSRIADRMSPSDNAPGAVGALIDQSFVLLIADVIDIAAAVFAILAVRSVGARQDAGLQHLMMSAPPKLISN